MPRLSIVAALALTAVAPAAFAQDDNTDDWSTPRVHLAFSGGTTMFRGGDPGLFIPFQPDTDSPTAEGTIAFRLARFVALEAGFAGTFGREEDGLQTPDNTFATAGFKIPVMARRVSPYLTFGGALISRSTSDEVGEILEDAFDVETNDKAAYAGAGLEFRLTRLLGVRGDYRYFRVFPEDVEDVGEREEFGIHRVVGGITFSF